MRALTLFILFNLVAVPLVGRLAWRGMEALNASGARLEAVGLSLVASIGILAVNILLIRRAAPGLPRLGLLVLWAIAGLTFALTVGTGFFSPLNLIWALTRG